MKTRFITFTVSFAKSNVSVSTIARMSDTEFNKFAEFQENYKYDVKYTLLPELQDIEAKNYSQLLEWLDNIKLYRYEYILHKVQTKVIHLPKGIVFNPIGYLEICLDKPWDRLTHEDILREQQLREWILQTFPTSTYMCSRAKFSLPAKTEELIGKLELTKNVISISPSGNCAIEVTKRIYKKEAILI